MRTVRTVRHVWLMTDQIQAVHLASRGIYGSRRIHAELTLGLVNSQFTRPAPDRLWVTDITEHPTREGKVYCAVVLDARRVADWAIDSSQTVTVSPGPWTWPSATGPLSQAY